MESKATLKYVTMAPRKIRRVARLIKGRNYIDAKGILTFTPKAASQVLLSTMKSAAANAIASEGSTRVKVENLFVKDVQINSGPIMKRIRPMAMGRAYRIRKRTAHINIVLAEKKAKQSPVKEA